MNPRLIAILTMIVIGALGRLLPHWPNFTPITAICLLGAAKLDRKWAAFLVPLAAMFVSDLALTILNKADLLSGWLAQGVGLYSGSWKLYSVFAVITLFGFVLRKRRSVLDIASVTLASSVFFFLATNFFVWFGMDQADRYPRTLMGLMECYSLAIPFFQYTLAGDVVFVTLFFGGYALIELYLKGTESATTTIA